MSDYILSPMNESQKFITTMSFKYNNRDITINDAVIDTGCNHSHFSANLLIETDLNNIEESIEEILRDKKLAAINAGYEISIGRGVESQGKNIDISSDIDKILNNKNVRFKEEFKDISINGHAIGDYKVKISYDTKNVALIGMDFIKYWNTYIGLSKDKTIILLACKRKNMNKNYVNMLYNTFPILTNI